MKRLLLFLILALSAHGQILSPILSSSSAAAAGTTITVGTTQKTQNAAASTTCVMTITPTAGQALFVTAIYNGAGSPVVSVKDNQAADDANWVIDWDINVFSPPWMFAAHIPSVSASVTSVTLTLTGSTFSACTVTPISYTGGTFSRDVFTAPTNGVFDGPGGTWTAPTVTPTAGKNEVIFGVGGSINGTPPATVTGTSPWLTAASAFSNTNNYYTTPIYQVITSTSGTYAPVGTANPDWFTFHGTIAFKVQ